MALVFRAWIHAQTDDRAARCVGRRISKPFVGLESRDVHLRTNRRTGQNACALLADANAGAEKDLSRVRRSLQPGMLRRNANVDSSPADHLDCLRSGRGVDSQLGSKSTPYSFVP